MPRLKNVLTGVVVNVSDEKAATLSGYKPVADSTKAAAKKAAPSVSKKDDSK